MADEKTKSYEVRLIKGFNHELGHSRAGYRFMPGPVPQTVELTKEQYELIDSDPSLEFVSKSESRRVAALTQDDITAPEASTNGRRYETSEPNGDEGDQEPAQDISKLTRKELNELATTLGVEDPQKLKNNQEVMDAIEEARANVKPEGTLDESGTHPDATFEFDGAEFASKTEDGGAQTFTRDGEEISQADFEAAQELAKSDESDQS